MMVIRPMKTGEERECEEILRLLPQWFGIESSLQQYVEDTTRYKTVVAEDQGAPVGFLTLRSHFAESCEIHCIAVRPDHHRRGVGRSLVTWAEHSARRSGVVLLQVKTLGPSRPDSNYEMTRQFYRSVGFVPLEEIHGLWGHNPCLIMVKVLIEPDQRVPA